jgi:hypothetical protein
MHLGKNSVIKAAFLLIPLHSIFAQLDIWLDEQGMLQFQIFNIIATLINLSFLTLWANRIEAPDEITAKGSVFESGSLLGAFFVAAAHPYFFYTNAGGNGWVPTVAFNQAYPSWILQLPQSGGQWLQVLYGLSLLGILASALFVFLRGARSYIAPQLSTQVLPVISNAANMESAIASMQREVGAMTSRIAKIEMAAPRGETRVTDWKSRKLKSLGAFEKMLDDDAG